MKVAILSDVHANLEALVACLAHARREGAEEFAFLGDLVGYGADPCACIDVVRAHAACGAIVLRGNHDDAALGGLWADMNPVSRESAIWTRGRLGDAEREFLAALPYVVARDDLLFVHASAAEPKDWEYIAGTVAAGRCLAATGARIVFGGHVHQPMLYFSARDTVSAFTPRPGVAVPLSKGRRWLVLGGSVGQPRDGNPAACYQLFDGVSRRLTFQRVAYDWITAATKVRSAGLPESLARRLEHGT
ncbi:MAG: metallophosphoesterase [Gammaproteobacteria bacterium]|nr:metallophosphoesterase [Gammaproteobacteria bacterium]MBU1414714.1 metallophosphoesterase [Gammaproteobacteria bacterium]